MEERKDQTGAGRVKCAGRGGKVAYRAAYPIQSSGAAQPSSRRMTCHRSWPVSSRRQRQNSRYSACERSGARGSRLLLLSSQC